MRYFLFSAFLITISACAGKVISEDSLNFAGANFKVDIKKFENQKSSYGTTDQYSIYANLIDGYNQNKISDYVNSAYSYSQLEIEKICGSKNPVMVYAPFLNGRMSKYNDSPLSTINPLAGAITNSLADDSIGFVYLCD